MQSTFSHIENIGASGCSIALNKQSEKRCRAGTSGNTLESPGYTH